MYTIIFVGVPVLFVLTVFVGLYSFAAEETMEEKAGADRLVAAMKSEAPSAVVPELVVLGVEQPVFVNRKPNSLEEIDGIIETMENRLRHEQQAAQNFAGNPSAETLWVN